ncbi:MAG: flagellar motor protein MotP [bacterium ADurb.Bin243]|nr:MAG: flagellar motor protein MotP [bacterium ADurb.Bin243]HOD40986.1 hypothetical protein [Candidatus Wallbacteria bacterium]
MIRIFSGILLFFIGFVSFSAMNGSPVALFINVHGLLLAFFFITAGFVASGWNAADLFNALNAKIENESHALRLIEMLSYMEKISVISSIIGLINGVVLILFNLGEASRIGPAAAVAILMPLYCAVFYLFAAIIKSRVKLSMGRIAVK